VAALDAYRALAGEAGDAADAGAAVAPGGEDDQRARYPYQPSVEALAALPRAATLQLEDGAIVEIELFVDVAPVMVARFAELARAGHYDGLTFHRVAPNFVIQGGSPGANEYSGVDRYVRDELGASNWRGTVGLSTRGRDTGDAQFYVNLVDNPRLDHEYTVFGRVTSSMDALDRVLEGAVIVKVSLA
jgi:cyclophilin family peptidyl-prolyl cis-trans isomerase